MRSWPLDSLHRDINGRVFAIWLLLVSLLCSTRPSIACLNPIGRDEVGTQIELDGISAQDFLNRLVTHEDKKYWKETLQELLRRKKSVPFIVDPNNIAVAMAHLGQIPEAIAILERHEKSKPGLYQTAANLGTAYELNGENEKALEWIREGVRRNPQEHNGTEWLHVRILKAKIALEHDPQWLNSNSVLGIDFASGKGISDDISVLDDFGIKRPLSEIESALVYQLHERLEFVKPQEPIVADLLYDLSRVFALTRTQDHSTLVRELAVSYGAGHDRNVLTTKVESESAGAREPGKSSSILIGLSLVSVGIILAGFYFLVIRRRSGSSIP